MRHSQPVIGPRNEPTRHADDARMLSGRARTKTEHDLPGDFEVPADAYRGVRTRRAPENFPVGSLPIAAHRDRNGLNANLTSGCVPAETCAASPARKIPLAAADQVEATQDVGAFVQLS